MSHSLEACRSYAKDEVAVALDVYDVVKYQCSLISRVNDICLEMGCCNGNKPKFEHLAEKLKKEINSITTDDSEKDKLYEYANKIMAIGRNYQTLNQSY